MTTDVLFDLSSQEFVENPFPTYKELLTHAPIYWCEQRQFYYISHQPFIKELFRDPRASSDRVKPMVANLPEAQQAAIKPLTSSLSKWLLFQDPPKHTPIRKLVNQALSAKVIRSMESEIQTTVDHLINSFIDEGQCELIKDFAYPLPAIIISKLLGVPTNDIDKIKAWSDLLARFLGDRTSLSLIAETQQAVIAMTAYLRKLLDQHRQAPTENVISQMIELQSQQPDFSDDDLIANCITLIFAGHETTTNLIANGFQLLLENPEQLIRLNTYPELIDQTVEECLRFASPVQRIGRLIKEPIDIGDVTLEAGKRVLLLIGAANRDPKFIENPDTFDIQRKPIKNLAFGHGIHLCSGAALGRLEATLAIKALANRLNKPKLVHKKPDWQYNLGLRAMKSCPITFEGQ